LVSPPGDNALELYKEVLDRDPDNAEALDALVEIKERLAALIESFEPVEDTSANQEQPAEVKLLEVPASQSVFDLKQTHSPVVAWISSAAVVLSVVAVTGAFYLRSYNVPKSDTVVITRESFQNAKIHSNIKSPPKNAESAEISRSEATLDVKSTTVSELKPEETESDTELTIETNPESAIPMGADSVEPKNTNLHSSDEELVAMANEPADLHLPIAMPVTETSPSEIQQIGNSDGAVERDESVDVSSVEEDPTPSAIEQTVSAAEVSGHDDIDAEPDNTLKEMVEISAKETTEVEEVTEVQVDKPIQLPLTVGEAIQDSAVNGDDHNDFAVRHVPDELVKEDTTESKTTQLENDEAIQSDLAQQESEANDESTSVMDEQSSQPAIKVITKDEEGDLLTLPAVSGAQDEPARKYEDEDQQTPQPQTQQMAEAVSEQIDNEFSVIDEVMVAAILEGDESKKSDLAEIKDAPKIDQSRMIEGDPIPDESSLERDERPEDVSDIENSLEEGKEDAEIDALEDLRGTQLIAAIKSDRMEQLSALLAEGINVDAVDAKGDNALIYAAWDGKNDIVQYLLDQGANVNHKNRIGWTALLSAVTAGHLDTVGLLTTSGADIHVASLGGKTALMAAARNGRTEIANRLLHSGVNVNQTNDEGWTALFYAVWYGHETVVAKLLEYGADVSIRDSTGINVETVAQNRGYKELAKILVEST